MLPMPPMNRTEFTALMTRLRSCYQNAITDQSLWLASVTTYWDLLSGYRPADVRAAFQLAWRRFPDWFPSAGQLASLIEGRNGDRAEEAWPEVLRLASKSSGDHSDPIAAEAIRRMGGGAALGRMRSDELAVWGKKEFLGLYQDVARVRDETRVRNAVQASQLAPGSPTGALGPKT